MIFFEHLIGFVIIAFFAIGAFRRAHFSKKELSALFTVSLLSGVIGTLFFTTALGAVGYIPFSVVLLIQKLQPIFAISVALMIGHEKIPKWSYLFMLIALISGYFITFPHGVSWTPDGQKTLTAALYALGAAAAWGSSTNFSKYLLKNHHPEVVTMLRFGVTALMVGIGLLLIPEWRTSFRMPTKMEWSYLFAIASSTGLLAMYIYYRGLKHTPVHVSAILELTWPIIAVAIDYFSFGTIFTLGQYIAIITLITSMYAVIHLSHTRKIENLAHTEKSPI